MTTESVHIRPLQPKVSISGTSESAHFIWVNSTNANHAGRVCVCTRVCVPHLLSWDSTHDVSPNIFLVPNF